MNCKPICLLSVLLCELALSSLIVSVNGETLGSWTLTTPYPTPVDVQSCVANGGYIYCVNGNLTSAANFAPVSSSGVGEWMSTTTSSILGDYGGSCVVNQNVSGNYIMYCVGGGVQSYLSSGVGYAQLSSSGIGTWSDTTMYPTPVQQASCVVSGGYIYCVGGYTSRWVPTGNVYFASLSDSGVGTWTSTTSYPTDIAENSCVASEGYVYCIGGATDVSPYTNAVYYASLSSSGIGAWTPTSNYPTNIAEHSCVLSDGYVYCIGGYDGSSYTSNVYYASLSDSGVGNWASTAPYPTPIGVQSCVESEGYIYCVGGATSYDATNAVYSSAVAIPNTLTMTVSYSVVGGGSPTAPVFHYVLSGAPMSLTLTKTATTVVVDAGSAWSVTPNPLTGSSSSQRWFSSQPLSGTASATTLVFKYQHQYYLTMKVSSATAGSVTPSSGWQNAGKTITIKATAKTGHAFKSWTGTGTGSYSGTSASHTITINSAITETATFG